jgi:pimeloyl-ACP methyl ester carboxylesterase
MTTFVLVHGAWGGSYSFAAMRTLLHTAGHEVFTPSLTGLGERVHLASPQVNLTTHVTDVANTVLYEDLTGIVLLGYSYGGMVVTGALEHIANRVSHLVYLDAFVPASGQSLNEVAGAPPGPVAAAVGPGARWLIPLLFQPPEGAPEPDPAAARLAPHPVGCFTEPVRLARPLEDYPFTRTYIKALREPRLADRPSAFWRAAGYAKGSPDWRYREIDTDHLVPVNRAEETVEKLVELTQ